MTARPYPRSGSDSIGRASQREKGCVESSKFLCIPDLIFFYAQKRRYLDSGLKKKNL